MRKWFVILGMFALIAFPSNGVWADAVLGLPSGNINDYYAINIDGAVSNPSLTNFNPLTGNATYTVSITGVGAHYVGAFFDYELSERANTYFNEYGTALGAPGAGQSWQIDDPFGSSNNIWTNLVTSDQSNSYLGNSNGVSSGQNDVSMALAWSFSLAGTETATINFVMAYGGTDPGGFYLQQTDPNSSENIYFSSSLNIGGGGQPVPEPATLLLLGSGLAGLFGFRKKLRK